MPQWKIVTWPPDRYALDVDGDDGGLDVSLEISIASSIYQVAATEQEELELLPPDDSVGFAPSYFSSLSFDSIHRA